MLKLAISGSLGRMGQRITQLAFQDPEFKIMTLLERFDHPQMPAEVNGVKIASDPSAIRGCDVLIEFTTPQASLDHLKACIQHHVKMVIGTTGFLADQVKVIEQGAQAIPIVLSSNMSVGVNIVFKMAKELARVTPDSYGVRMVEAHHVHKKDAPSGTAKTLKKIVEDHSSHRVADIQSIREGEIIGDHKVIFESAEDIITLAHHAKSRDIFAKGSLVAAKFLAGRKKGLFDMQDVLGMK